jgi:transposase
MLTPARSYGVGVDVHSQFAAICVLVQLPGHKELAKHEMQCAVFTADLRRAKEWVFGILAAYQIVPQPLIYAIESTATYHYPVVRTWAEAPIIVNPGLAAQYKARKTDRFDASVLAYQTLTGLFEPSHVPSAETEELRLLLRSRRKMVRQRTQHYNAIGTRLSQWYCPLAGTSARASRVRALIEDAAQGKFQSGEPSFASAHLVPARIWSHILRHYEVIDHLQKQIDYYEEQALALADPELFHLVQTVPGVGRLTALTWLAEVEPASRFLRVKQVVAYCGFDPTPMVSAGKVVSSRCRKGNSHIRTALVQAAHSALRGQTMLALWGRSLKKHRNVQITAIGRKIVSALYRISLTRKPWEDRCHVPEETQRPEPASQPHTASTPSA